jgi:hypothetical protein
LKTPETGSFKRFTTLVLKGQILKTVITLKLASGLNKREKNRLRQFYLRKVKE